MCQACTFGIKATGNDGGATLGEVRGRQFAAAANTCGRTMSRAATVVACALLGIIGTLGCHRPWQTLCVGAQSLGRSTSPRHHGGQWPQWQWRSSCRAQREQLFEQERRLFVAAAMALPTAVTAATNRSAATVRAAWRYPQAASDTAGGSEHPTWPITGGVGCFEHQRRAAAACLWRWRDGQWHCASVRLPADESSATPGGLGGVGSLKRHRRKGGRGTPHWWRRVNGWGDGGSLSATWAWEAAPLAWALEFIR